MNSVNPLETTWGKFYAELHCSAQRLRALMAAISEAQDKTKSPEEDFFETKIQSHKGNGKRKSRTLS